MPPTKVKQCWSSAWSRHFVEKQLYVRTSLFLRPTGLYFIAVFCVLQLRLAQERKLVEIKVKICLWRLLICWVTCTRCLTQPSATMTCIKLKLLATRTWLLAGSHYVTTTTMRERLHLCRFMYCALYEAFTFVTCRRKLSNFALAFIPVSDAMHGISSYFIFLAKYYYSTFLWIDCYDRLVRKLWINLLKSSRLTCKKCSFIANLCIIEKNSIVLPLRRPMVERSRVIYLTSAECGKFC